MFCFAIGKAFETMKSISPLSSDFVSFHDLTTTTQPVNLTFTHTFHHEFLIFIEITFN